MIHFFATIPDLCERFVGETTSRSERLSTSMAGAAPATRTGASSKTMSQAAALATTRVALQAFGLALESGTRESPPTEHWIPMIPVRAQGSSARNRIATRCVASHHRRHARDAGAAAHIPATHRAGSSHALARRYGVCMEWCAQADRPRRRFEGVAFDRVEDVPPSHQDG